ncbi:hypothetical protein JHD49_01500 [Sulfurimonas sp. SAG-AH-194-C21]|nr:hypothetical protein [Sulfurimonas sp. SAG-AH-194-C21]MDF1882610.1 hypothetical protein [Sulfurimonas sp. SAG-AH-194-C21]
MLPSMKDLEHSLGGRPDSSKSKVRISVYIDKADNEALRLVCTKVDIAVSTLIRKLIKEYLSHKPKI